MENQNWEITFHESDFEDYLKVLAGLVREGINYKSHKAGHEYVITPTGGY